jgi:hypothetical protein
MHLLGGMRKAWLLCIVSAVVTVFGKADIEAECVDKTAFDRPAAATSLLSKSSTALHSVVVEEETTQSGMPPTLHSLNLKGKLASLLEHSSVMLGNAGVDITPGVNETIGKLIETIQNSILENIKHHHQETQQRVRSKISELTQKTNFAVGAHREAAFTDIDYVKCMRDLSSCHGSHATCINKLGVLTSAANASCTASHGKRFYKSSESVHAQSIPVLECDYALPRSECKFDDFKTALANWADTLIKPELETNRSKYDAAKQICDQDENNKNNQSQNCTETRENCDATELNCKELETRRDVSMCTFGDRLQEKCASKASYDELAANIRGNGSVHSDPDRRYEWRSAELIKCMLHDHRMGADFDKATMEKCKPLSNYSRDVGVLDFRLDDYREQTSDDNFDCIQTAVNFSGVNVVETPGSPDPTFNFITPYAPIVNFSLGATAFGICSTSADSKTCGSNFINQTCPAGWQLKPQQESIPCVLSASCTFADCCE